MLIGRHSWSISCVESLSHAAFLSPLGMFFVPSHLFLPVRYSNSTLPESIVAPVDGTEDTAWAFGFHPPFAHPCHHEPSRSVMSHPHQPGPLWPAPRSHRRGTSRVARHGAPYVSPSSCAAGTMGLSGSVDCLPSGCQKGRSLAMLKCLTRWVKKLRRPAELVLWQSKPR